MTLCRKFSKGIFFVTGFLLLLAGTMIYFFCRPHQVIFMQYLPKAVKNISGASYIGGNLFGVLPAFFHTSAFTLMSAGVLDLEGKQYFGLAAFWTGLNICFEFGQKFKMLSASIISFIGIDDRITAVLKAGAVNGIYDINDIFSALCGGIFSLVLIAAVLNSKKQYDEPVKA